MRESILKCIPQWRGDGVTTPPTQTIAHLLSCLFFCCFRKDLPPPLSATLHKTENAYRIGASGENDPNEDLRRQVKSILNKMSPEKFEKLTEQLATLGIVNGEQLAILVDLVFAKAVSEHPYCEMYSDLCMTLRTKYPHFPPPVPDAPPQNFTRFLLNRCQTEFEHLPTELPAIADPNSGEAEQLMKQKERILGNMKFIGQLFLRRLLSHKVVREVVTHLIFRREKPQEHFIECLCMLLRNIGSTLEDSTVGSQYTLRKK